MKVINISDTHNYASDVVLPMGDLLIHAGDFTNMCTIGEMHDFVDWLKRVVPFYPRGCIIIAGNHDLGFDGPYHKLFEDMLTEIPGVTYLNDSGCSVKDGNKEWKVWGSPVTPEFCSWAFNRKRGNEIRKHWDFIPDDTNILITHGPPLGIRDANLGCSDLRTTTETRLKSLKLHVFGHIHPPHGVSQLDGVYFVNAALCTIVKEYRIERYKLTHQPIVIELI